MARRSNSSLVYLGIRGRVIALNRMTGDEFWRTELKGSGFVQVARDQDYVYATTRGEIFCLKPDTGELVWNNPLKGYGSGAPTSLLSVRGQSSEVILQQAAAIAAQTAAHTAAAGS